MTIHAPSDTTSFDACLRLFERYPLAVARHCADGGYLSMVLLTSDLVTNAIRHQPGGTITLGVRCAPGQLRVDVHGSVIGRDLILVQTLSDDWGCYPTPAGQAVYFTLAFSSDGRDA